MCFTQPTSQNIKALNKSTTEYIQKAKRTKSSKLLKERTVTTFKRISEERVYRHLKAKEKSHEKTV